MNKTYFDVKFCNPHESSSKAYKNYQSDEKNKNKQRINDANISHGLVELLHSFGSSEATGVVVLR